MCTIHPNAASGAATAHAIYVVIVSRVIERETIQREFAFHFFLFRERAADVIFFLNEIISFNFFVCVQLVESSSSAFGGALFRHLLNRCGRHNGDKQNKKRHISEEREKKTSITTYNTQILNESVRARARFENIPTLLRARGCRPFRRMC